MKSCSIITKGLSQVIEEIIDPFEMHLLKGIYYPVRVGEKAWISANTKEGREKRISSLQHLTIQPGREAIVRSWEKFTLPKDILVIIEPKDLYAEKGIIIFSRGSLSPGFLGYIFFTISNFSDVNVDINLGDYLGNIIFIQLGDKVDFHEEAFEPSMLPRLTNEIETHPELVAKVDMLVGEIKSALRNDHILLDIDIKTESKEKGLIQPYNEDNILPDGYKFCLGDHADVFIPKKGAGYFSTGRLAFRPSERDSLIIEPGRTVLIRTLEEVNLPPNISMDLEPLPNLTRKYLNFDGKRISPGYRGFIWCNLHNYGTAVSEIKFREKIFFATFKRLGKTPTRPLGYKQEPSEYFVNTIPDDEIPTTPTSEWDDLVSLTNRVEKLESDVRGYGPTKQIIDLVFMAIVAGIIAGFFLAIFPIDSKDLSQLLEGELAQNIYYRFGYYSLGVIIITLLIYFVVQAFRKNKKH